MTSEAPTECFVYLTLPGQTEPVTAGRFAMTTDRRGTPEGRFVYGRSYLERPNALALDPIGLKLSSRTYSTIALGGVFGALRDASPDYWGRHVIQRHLGKAQPGEMEYLLYSPDDRAGALGFGLNQTPPAPKRTFNQTLDLEKVQVIADAIGSATRHPFLALSTNGRSMSWTANGVELPGETSPAKLFKVTDSGNREPAKTSPLVRSAVRRVQKKGPAQRAPTPSSKR